MWLKLLNLLSLSLVLSSNAWASQVIDHAEKRHQQASISVHEQNRLVIEGRKIVSVVPSQAGVISVVKDEALGALYFTLANELHHGSVTLFVSDDAGVTYKLILAPRAIPGEEIIIRPPKGGKAGRRGHTTSYQRQVKDLLLGMIDGDKSGIVAVNKKVRLWKEVDLFFLSKHLSHDGLDRKSVV